MGGSLPTIGSSKVGVSPEKGAAAPAPPIPSTAPSLSTAGFLVAVALGLGFLAIVQLGVRYAELVTGRYITGGVPPIPAFGALLVLLGVRPLLRRVFRVDLSRE